MLTYDLDLSIRDATVATPIEQIFLLTDENASIHCLPLVLKTITIPREHILTIPAGDSNKTLAFTEQIWNFLFSHGATRSSLLLNLGGGMICDMGGFAAATYMRGISYVNIPTTLLADVDAASGGKVGINYNGIKNAIGTFARPKAVIISADFLATLPTKEFLSGFAEMLKHSLISSPLELNRILSYDIDSAPHDELCTLIERSLIIKNYIVEQDPEEHGLRKSLNFGHTIGHAIEQYQLRAGDPIPHGYAVFYGLLAELYLSVKLLGLNDSVIRQCLPLLYNYYGKPQCSCRDQDELIELMRHDKKNIAARHINFTLLKAVGNARINQECADADIREALDWLFAL